MLILGIETSCDETSAAIVRDGRQVIHCLIATSGQDFRHLGGVIPEDAARQQLVTMLPVLEKTLSASGTSKDALDAIAVAMGPGLLGSLLVGTTTARVLASVWQRPLIGVHHTLGHLSSPWLTDAPPDPSDEPAFPLLALSVSGGHTELWYRTSHTTGSLLGSTRDDAAGEAFDKGAAMLGLPYPGGPALEKLAEDGDSKRFSFPLPLHDSPVLDFSFSGLKTSLKYLLRDLRAARSGALPPRELAAIAASYQRAICAHLTHRVSRALERFPDAREVHIVGGVAANLALRKSLEETLHSKAIRLRMPVSLRYCTDNGAMIAAAGTFLVREKPKTAYAQFRTFATGNLSA